MAVRECWPLGELSLYPDTFIQGRFDINMSVYAWNKMILSYLIIIHYNKISYTIRYGVKLLSYLAEQHIQLMVKRVSTQDLTECVLELLSCKFPCFTFMLVFPCTPPFHSISIITRWVLNLMLLEQDLQLLEMFQIDLLFNANIVIYSCKTVNTYISKM